MPRHGMEWHGLAWYVMASHAMAWHGMARHGMVRRRDSGSVITKWVRRPLVAAGMFIGLRQAAVHCVGHVYTVHCTQCTGGQGLVRGGWEPENYGDFNSQSIGCLTLARAGGV